MHSTVWLLPLALSVLLSECGAAVPSGEYCVVPTNYNAQCIEIRNDQGITSSFYPLSSDSQVRPFCGDCHDSYNLLTVNGSTSPCFVISDVGSLNVLTADRWSPWKIGNCDPVLLHSVGAQVYVLCRFASTDRQVIVYTVYLAADASTVPNIVAIPFGSTIGSDDPKASTFFVVSDDVHLCIAGANALLFYNFRTGVPSSQVAPCTFVGQLTPFQAGNGQGFILVECTDGSDLLTVTQARVYDINLATFVNTSILGLHSLGKNAISLDGDVIASWQGTTCVFSQLEGNSTVLISFKGAIHSAGFVPITGLLVFVAAVTGPDKGLYKVNVSLTLTGSELGLPEFVDGSADVCVADLCSGIALTRSEFVLAAIEEGTQVHFFSLFSGSHFGPIDIGTVVTRIGVVSSAEVTDSGDTHLPPRNPLAQTFELSIGISAPVVLAGIAIAIVVAVCCLCRRCNQKRMRQREMTMTPTSEAGRSQGWSSHPSSIDLQSQTSATERETVMVHGMFPISYHSSAAGSRTSMTTGPGSSRFEPVGACET